MARISILQLPKDPGFLECLKPSPGCSLVYLDFAALEPHVLTEFSQDPNMLKLYGPGAKPNDIYLFVGASTSVFGEKIRQTFDPENPTPDAIKTTKKACAIEREILKVAVLGLGYGMHPPKLQAELSLKGFPVPLHEAQAIFDDYWRWARGIKNFHNSLMRQYDKNGGYIVNGRGRPLAVHAKYKNDIVNKFVQSSGHDILMFYLTLIQKRRIADKVFMKPYVVDEHDCTIWQVVDEHVEQVKKIFADSMDELNQTLNWSVKFSGNIKSGKSLAVKCAD